MKKYLLLIVVLTGLYFATRVLYFWDRPNSDENTRVSFTVTPGSSFTRIKTLLEDKGLIAVGVSF